MYMYINYTYKYVLCIMYSTCILTTHTSMRCVYCTCILITRSHVIITNLVILILVNI